MWRKLKRWAHGRRPGREGFTLVEIMMVLVILSVGVLPIAIIQHRARGEVNEADRHTQGIAVAQMQLERLKSQGFGNIVNENGTEGAITWVAQVDNVAFGLDRVTVTATWQNKDAVETLVVSNLVSMR
ncbi:MAG: prepilin-type N-terminal cleavage/methylation domain-containing protein [bacterium]|nr:prepilin-type N-terminal cleavage/methylation domain-containing protein [bacterium]